MAEDRQRRKKPLKRLIGVLALCWFLIFGLITALLLLDAESAPLDVSEAVALGNPFPLQGTPADRFSVIGQRLVRIEEEGLAVLDAAGKEQSYLAFPYRTPRVIAAGEGLVIVPERGGGLMAVRTDLTALELDTDDVVLGAALSSGHILAFGPSSQGMNSLILLEAAKGAYRAHFTFSDREWPVTAAFEPSGTSFGLVLLDLSTGQTRTRFLRFDLDGTKTADFQSPYEGLYPGLAYLGNRVALYNDERMILVDLESGDMEAEIIPGRLEALARAGGKMAILTREGHDYSFHLVGSGSGEGSVFFEIGDYGSQIRAFAYAADGSFLLAATEDEFLVLDSYSGTMVARQPSGGQVERLIALDSHHFFLVMDGQGLIATVG